MVKPDREQLRNAVIQASRENSTVAVFFHSAIAEQFGLGATDEKTLFILQRYGSLTAGEIAQHTGLTTASVTNLIDRLERKGFVQRVRDTADRRRVIVQPDQARLAEFNRVFGSIQASFDTMLNDYSDSELAVIADFLVRATQYARETIEKFDQGSRSADTA
jgi:DNA-binding MarR family transcriptional regulator